MTIISDIRKTRGMGRKRINHDVMVARFPEGTFDGIDAVLESGETRTDFLRVIVEREIKRRKRKKVADDEQAD